MLYYIMHIRLLVQLCASHLLLLRREIRVPKNRRRQNDSLFFIYPDSYTSDKDKIINFLSNPREVVKQISMMFSSWIHSTLHLIQPTHMLSNINNGSLLT